MTVRAGFRRGARVTQMRRTPPQATSGPEPTQPADTKPAPEPKKLDPKPRTKRGRT